MARPAEKARSMLNKWVAMREKSSDAPRPSFKRPKLVQECDNKTDAQRFRNQVIRDISNKISEIQNPGLGEHVIRDLNDEINRLLREKHQWNKRIFELGGPNYNEIERQRQIEEGGEVQTGYQYFGAAKELPGVKEMLEKRAEKLSKMQQDYRHITPAYYGWGDEEDGVLLELEEFATKKNEQVYKGVRVSGSEDALGYLDIMSEEEIAEKLLEHKKKALLEEFNL